MEYLQYAHLKKCMIFWSEKVNLTEISYTI